MIDYYSGNNNNVVAKNYKPKWTIWSPKEIKDSIKNHKRHARRSYKQYLRTGRIQDFNRSQRKITRWDFD